MIERGDDLIEEGGGLDAGVEDDRRLAGVVATVDAPAGEVDADVAVLEFIDPRAGRACRPRR